MYEPYPFCLGRKYRFIPKLNRPLAVLFNTFICNKRFTDKQKISFLMFVIRIFFRDCLGFHASAFFKNGIKCLIEKGDFIYLVCNSTKAIIRKLFLKLGLVLNDYKVLKRRKYTLVFTFFICDNVYDDKNITLDITCHNIDKFEFFITLGIFYQKDLIQLLLFFNLEEEHMIDIE
jgi:hypothetical protein